MTTPFAIAIAMLLLESVIIYYYPVTKFPVTSVFLTRIVAAVVIVTGSYLLADYIQTTSRFDVNVDITPFLTGLLVVLFEFFIYNSYALRGFTQGTDLDPFNKILAKFTFTVCAVFLAKGMTRDSITPVD
ncbi:hypothetical protein EB118_01980 [bacterium]|nr:hypothetical protein [bacterium]NDC94186.1 hypothetical protein [bacterium]NDD83018.1 hypothetical protein [bacterium]NDG28856.1 hypothetical protein [bacterium]